MGFLDFAIRLKILVDEIEGNREEESVVIAGDVMAQIRNRVQERKVDADGSPFGQYSQALVPQWFFYGKSNNQTAEADLRAGDWFVSYAEFRDLNGLSSDDIDFTFSGDLFKTTGVVTVENENDSTTVVLGGQNARSEQILEWQEPRYGNIIEPSEQEIEFAFDAHRERVFNTINRILQ